MGITNFEVLQMLNVKSFASIVFEIANRECKTLEEFERMLHRKVPQKCKEALEQSLKELQHPTKS